jgi:hypothetical protein
MQNNAITAMQNKYLFVELMTFDERQHLCFVKYVMGLAYKHLQFNVICFIDR